MININLNVRVNCHSTILVFFAVIFPSKGNQTLLTLLKLHLDRPNIGTFEFRSRFVRTTWLSNETQLRSINWSEAVAKLQQDRRLFDYNDRSKFIVKPEALLKLGVHWMFAFRSSSYQELKVKPQDALIYHMKPETREISPIPIDRIFQAHLQSLFVKRK